MMTMMRSEPRDGTIVAAALELMHVAVRLVLGSSVGIPDPDGSSPAAAAVVVDAAVVAAVVVVAAVAAAAAAAAVAVLVTVVERNELLMVHHWRVSLSVILSAIAVMNVAMVRIQSPTNPQEVYLVSKPSLPGRGAETRARPPILWNCSPPHKLILLLPLLLPELVPVYYGARCLVR